MSFLNTYKHLLPHGKAWSITAEKNLRRLFDGLSLQFVKDYFDVVWQDIFPDTTQALDEWEAEFGLPDTGLSEAERRIRLASRWQELGAPDPRYIEDTLRAAGFDVYVHEWWYPETIPTVGVHSCAIPRDPTPLVLGELSYVWVACGEAVAQCGEDHVQCGEKYISYRGDPVGYLLANIEYQKKQNLIVLCNEPSAQCGEDSAQCGARSLISSPRSYDISFDKRKWPYMLYIGGEIFPNVATVLESRKAELEELILRIRPLQHWLVMLIDYV